MRGRYTRLVLTVVASSVALSVGSACQQPPVAQSGAPRVNTFRVGPATAVLGDGRVLVAGGEDLSEQPLRSAELYDPLIGEWTRTASMAGERAGHTATLLRDGRVLVAGGSHCRRGCSGRPQLASAELYNPASGQWQVTAPMHAHRSEQSASLLADGRVLVTGGNGWDRGDTPSPSFTPRTLRSAEVFDPVTGAWTAVAPMLRTRWGHASFTLADGRVLVIGGNSHEDYGDQCCALSASTNLSGEIYDPTTNS
jgi:hypothetical protein